MDSRYGSVSVVKFEGYECDACGRGGIEGTLWKCELCFNYDLCDHCYKGGKHYYDHPFLLLKKTGDTVERVPPRKKSGRVPSSPIREGDSTFYGITCDACGQRGISGVRWKCDECIDYDLCSHCYMNSEHAAHPFMRFDRPRDKGLRVPPRQVSTAAEARGIVHWGINCNDCGERGIYGTRWKCLPCLDLDLCGACYVGGRHSEEHAFLCIKRPGSDATTVPPRKTMAQSQRSYLTPGGVKFSGISCNSCNRDSFFGPRWKCTVCTNYDLCAACYLCYAHNPDHAFTRFDRPHGRWIRVRPKQPSTDAEESMAMLHKGVHCNGCGDLGILGERWKCQLCYGFDLCTPCYLSDMHDKQHPFLRIDSAGGVAVKVPPRDTRGRTPVISSTDEGFTFHGLTCDGCGQSPISGASWKCDVCDDYDLCTFCFVSDTHNVGHLFVRYENYYEEGIRVAPEREQSMLNSTSIRHKDAKFRGIVCDVCSQRDIVGTRWKCAVCHDYDLCTTCYAGKKHNLDHAFLRFDVPGGEGKHVQPRQQSTDAEDKVENKQETKKQEARTSPSGDHTAQTELATKLRELEVTLQCVICMERRRNVAFLCGHSACAVCAEILTACHMCRVPIARRITLY
ncbi:uncharacterized protein LOC119390054 [Rhipicephalus sanguineus]|uniref:uncharacterized protein LOC119390054 n=1 Tax=Rhipicephalus sanguineus TaxID=34632 RepID=UPI001895E133|nr:uncharacterized protein LOC119390054 [Rhipicephalus sanguineus]